jgi:predicted transcriptional regulator of viral defense system
MKFQGLKAERRKNLAKLLSAEKGAITIDSASKILGWDREKTQIFLSSLSRSGWLKSIKPGVFVPVPLESDETVLTEENAFVLAHYLYGSCYIGGWSAASFWGLTDQIFMKTWVMASTSVRKKEETKSGHTFLLRHIPESYFFGLHNEWIKQDKVLISDPHKTIIDFANFVKDFDLYGLLDLFTEYLKSDYKNLDVLLDYAAQSGNRAVFKRIGFLLELLEPAAITHINRCLQNISKGVSELSPGTKSNVYNKKWRLRVPESMVEHDNKKRIIKKI